MRSYKGKRTKATVSASVAAMLAAGLVSGNVLAKSPTNAFAQKYLAANTSYPAQGRGDVSSEKEKIVEVSIYDLLRLFETDGLVSVHFLKTILGLTASEEKLFVEYAKAGVVALDDAVNVLEGLDDLQIPVKNIYEAIDDTPVLNKTGIILRQGILENKDRILSKEKISDIAKKADLGTEVVTTQFFFEKLRLNKFGGAVA